MAEPGATRSRAAVVALVFAITGAAICWNPLAAPLGLIVGGGAIVLAVRALKLQLGSRKAARAALALGILGAVAGLTVLLLSAGLLGGRLGGEPVVVPRTPAEMKALLDAAAERTAESRARASKELDQLGTAGASDGGTRRDARGGRQDGAGSAHQPARPKGK